MPYLLKASKDENVLVEFRVKGNTLDPASPPHYFDLEATRPGRYGRAVSVTSATAATGTTDPFALTISFLSAPYGARAPDLQSPFPPEAGATFEVVLRHAPAGAVAALVFGLQEAWVDLAPLGAPGCRLYCDCALSLPVAVDAAGQAVHAAALPADPNLVGLPFWNQAVVRDLQANPIGLVLTNAARAVIGG